MGMHYVVGTLKRLILMAALNLGIILLKKKTFTHTINEHL